MAASLWDPGSIIPASGHFTTLLVDNTSHFIGAVQCDGAVSVAGALTGPTITAINLAISTNATNIAANLVTLNAQIAADIWTTPAFSAANFTASGAMTWTLASGDLLTYAYKLKNKTMVLSVYINMSTVGGVVSNQLRIAIPAGQIAAKAMVNACVLGIGASQIPGYLIASTGLAYISVQKVDLTNFTVGADNTYVFGQIEFEVQ